MSGHWTISMPGRALATQPICETRWPWPMTTCRLEAHLLRSRFVEAAPESPS